jgi:hypothetical protein
VELRIIQNSVVKIVEKMMDAFAFKRGISKAKDNSLAS